MTDKGILDMARNGKATAVFNEFNVTGKDLDELLDFVDEIKREVIVVGVFDKDQEKALKLIKGGHSYNCMMRQIYRDGECECINHSYKTEGK